MSLQQRIAKFCSNPWRLVFFGCLIFWAVIASWGFYLV